LEKEIFGLDVGVNNVGLLEDFGDFQHLNGEVDGNRFNLVGLQGSNLERTKEKKYLEKQVRREYKKFPGFM
jgi:hypothetical protein